MYHTGGGGKGLFEHYESSCLFHFTVLDTF